MSHFMFLSDVGGPRWVVMGMVVKLAQSVGLAPRSTHPTPDLDFTDWIT